ncbi:YdcH family protein [Sphingomonas sp.]|uniref:YdcH family protein n=1 Tax=Sphingomonas sp. TaxID=28214 RepID=UPI0025E01AAF|nr:YdcH family protein [Sphingomonas sp.]MBV9527426.1 YdcH family protein [Sphingomonas sp.]
MNDDEPQSSLDELRTEHRRLDARIQELSAEAGPDKLEVARLKKRKLLIKDEIQRILDSSIPDIIA